jgi:hypothetical protein
MNNSEKVNMGDLQDAVNAYAALSAPSVSENEYKKIIDILIRSCNKNINNAVNENKEYSNLGIDSMRKYLFEFARNAIKNFLYNPSSYTNDDLITIVISIGELTNDNSIKWEADKLLDKTLKMNTVIDLCNKFIGSS